TTDPLNDEDRTETGFNFRLVPQLRSTDLVHWTYVGEAFTSKPSWATADAGLWAPEIEYDDANDRYILYVTVTNTTFPGGGSAIAAATSGGPTGEWEWADDPVVEPHAPDCCPNDKRWVFDPDVIQVPEGDFIYYGSYFGGISVRELSDDLLHSDPATQSNVAIANKYEGPEVVSRGGWYYLFASATDCCRGPLTGYAVLVGRSHSPTGPFLDRSGVDLNDDETPADLTDGRAGGSPVLVGNDAPWVGTGHNTVFQDLAGQWWTIYHAVNRNEPYFEGAVGFTKRPVLLDAIDWVDGWPTINGGRGISTHPTAAPAAQPGDTTTHHASARRKDRTGARVRSLSDSFSGTELAARWSWIREPAAGTWSVSGGRLRMDTQAADLFEGSNNASVLVERAPKGPFVAETRVRLNVPAEGCCFNYVQAGLVLYENDDSFVKLAVVSIYNTRQTEWAKEVPPGEPGYPRYGNSIVGPPGGFTVTEPTASPLGAWTDLRIVRRIVAGKEAYTAYTRAENGVWEKGMTWRHELGSRVRIGLIAMGGSGYTAEFDRVLVSRLR
ncbi:MAG TPA: family 43 glycosylhydrolase, partial [Candidatus Limnocylindrales bacterium]|nr:family 43 glycosylhydrolase [Candidatus Limnocylindrales bacterium]